MNKTLTKVAATLYLMLMPVLAFAQDDIDPHPADDDPLPADDQPSLPIDDYWFLLVIGALIIGYMAYQKQQRRA